MVWGGGRIDLDGLDIKKENTKKEPPYATRKHLVNRISIKMEEMVYEFTFWVGYWNCICWLGCG